MKFKTLWIVGFLAFALVLGGVVVGQEAKKGGAEKKGGDRFRFIRPVLERNSSDTKNMRNVRNPRFLAHLISMRPGCINQRFLKLFRQLHN